MNRRSALAAGIAALSLLILPKDAPAEMYKWTDRNGTLHITDYPPPGGAGKPMNFDSIRINRLGSGAGGSAPAAVPAGQGPAPASAPASAPRDRGYPRVEVYGTDWCPACREARAWLRSAGIPFEDYDVEKDKSARARMDRLGGSGVPAIVIGGRVFRGFSQAWCEAALGIR